MLLGYIDAYKLTIYMLSYINLISNNEVNGKLLKYHTFIHLILIYHTFRGIGVICRLLYAIVIKDHPMYLRYLLTLGGYTKRPIAVIGNLAEMIAISPHLLSSRLLPHLFLCMFLITYTRLHPGTSWQEH
jgi:hypothetical protein